MLHPLQSMIQSRQNGAKVGIPSYCSANELVLETALARAKASGQPVLIEATANQVNQYGGYTGMLPADFYQFVMKLAAAAGVPAQQIILAGDHLGRICPKRKPWPARKSWSMNLQRPALQRSIWTPA